MGEALSVLLTVHLSIGLFIGMIFNGVTMFAPSIHGESTKTADDIPWQHWLTMWLGLMFLWPLMLVAVILLGKLSR